VEIGTEVAQFPGMEYIDVIFLQCGLCPAIVCLTFMIRQSLEYFLIG
jgi:hypothetical protein